MKWIEKNIDVRFNPKLLLKDAKIAVVVLQSHKIKVETQNNKIARYALQEEDYHISIKRKLKILSEKIARIIPNVKFRACVDSAPILEKYWAQKAGLGFIGKNTLFISNKIGSFCNIGILLTDADIPVTQNFSLPKNSCENCDECIKSCPSKALVKPYTLDCNRCVSYQSQQKTISDFDCFGWTLGCDVCQEVCPENEK